MNKVYTSIAKELAHLAVNIIEMKINLNKCPTIQNYHPMDPMGDIHMEIFK